MRTKVQFWRDMEAEWRKLDQERTGPVTAIRNPDGHWTFTGAPADVARTRALAAICGRASMGEFPPDVR